MLIAGEGQANADASQQADEQADGVAGYHLETPRTFSQLLPAT